MQCRNCWAMLSHETRHCRSRQPTCGKCAGQHETDSCEAGVSRCALCDGPHPAWHRRCPAHAEANEHHKMETQKKKDEHRAKGDAASRPSPPIWPPSPEEWPIPGGPIVTPTRRPAPPARPRSLAPGPGAKPPAPRPQEAEQDASGSEQSAEPGTPSQGVPKNTQKPPKTKASARSERLQPPKRRHSIIAPDKNSPAKS